MEQDSTGAHRRLNQRGAFSGRGEGVITHEFITIALQLIDLKNVNTRIKPIAATDSGREPPVPAGFTVEYDSTSGFPYFFNSVTGESRWDLPNVGLGRGDREQGVSEA